MQNNRLLSGLGFHKSRLKRSLIANSVTRYAVFFPAFTRAHLALCAAAIFLRAEAESVRLLRMGTTLACAPAFSRTFAQRARWAAPSRARADAESLLVPVPFP